MEATSIGFESNPIVSSQYASDRVCEGVDAQFAGGASLSLSAEVGGIGSTLQSCGIKAKASMPIS